MSENEKTYRKRIWLANFLAHVLTVIAIAMSAAIMVGFFYLLVAYPAYILMAACVVTLVAWLIVRGSSAKVSS